MMLVLKWEWIQAYKELGLLMLLVGVAVLTFASLVYFAEKVFLLIVYFTSEVFIFVYFVEKVFLLVVYFTSEVFCLLYLRSLLSTLLRRFFFSLSTLPQKFFFIFVFFAEKVFLSISIQIFLLCYFAFVR